MNKSQNVLMTAVFHLVSVFELSIWAEFLDKMKVSFSIEHIICLINQY